MTAVQAGHTNNYLNKLWGSASSTMDRQNNQLLNIQPCCLPTLTTRSQNNQLPPDGAKESHHLPTDVTCSTAEGEARPSNSSEFRSRLRLGIYKGNSTSVAMDPEHHMQLVKEKQALHEQRQRPKSPITLQPVHVLPLSKPKAKKTKTKNQRLSRSAPELVHARNVKQELSSHMSTATWASENHLQLPLLTRDSNVGLSEMMRANEVINSTSGAEPAAHQHPTATYFTNSPEPRLQIISAARMNQLKPKHNGSGNKPTNLALKSSQSNYAALREQRLLSERLRAFDTENLAISAQSYRQKDVESILEMVEQAQDLLRCPKQNGRRSCGICPPTAGIVRKGRVDSAHLPELIAADKAEAIDKTRKALIVQLPNISSSRANTPFL